MIYKNHSFFIEKKMKAAILIGDKTDHGGVVTQVDQTFIIDGNAVHVSGMQHFCPKCRTIVTAIAGSQSLIINNKAMIVAGDKASCGATFISTQNLLVRE